MGFLPNLFKIPSHDIIPNIITLGTYGLVKGSIQEGARVAAPILKSVSGLLVSPKVNASQSSSPYYVPGSPSSGPPPQYNITYGAPSYGGGGGAPFDQFSYQPSADPWGTPSWGSSMMYSTPSPALYPVYSPSPPSQGRTWEDIALQVAPFFL